MYSSQNQWNLGPVPTGTYTWSQGPRKQDPTPSNNYTQASSCPDDLSHLFDTNIQKQSPSHGQPQLGQVEEYPYLHSLPSSQPSASTVTAGPIQPCNLNIVLKPDQTDTSAQSSELRARVESLERILDGLQASLAILTKKVETSSGFEEHVANSLDAITKGMEKFFNRFASHLEDEEVKLAEACIIEVEEATM